MSGDNYRVRIGPADEKGPHAYACARTVLPAVEGDVVDGALVLYVKSRPVAQSVIAAQHRDDVLWSDIALWDEAASLWRTVETAGNPRMVLKHWEIPDAEPKRPAASRTMDALAGRRRLPLWIVTVGVVVVFVVAFGLAYLVGSRPGGLQKAHDARDSFVEAVIAALAALAFAISLRRNR
jgi:hypothetical protein